jgi:RHS repeat-associated protein
MSKVGSNKNIGKFDCSWLIVLFSEGATPAEKPEETLAKADKSEAKLLKAYNVTPAPDYKQNAGYAQNCISSHGIDFAGETKQAYWYHSDHLGSASYITGVDGKVCSNINYFPTGEVFVEQNLKTNVLPYKFNGKELDAETGYYYYGARYYNPKVSLWLNVDPLAEKTGAPYNYCYNNPVKLVDPDGMEPSDIVIRGKNKSSITIKTNLIKINLDAGLLGLDFKGNYTLQGDDILEAAFDIGGFIDQSGLIDGAAGMYYANKGDWGNAMISAASVIPGGDVAKVGKISKHIKTIDNAIDALKYTDNTKTLLKTGRSGKQERLMELATDPKLGKADKGWIKSEMNQIERGNRKTIRNPPGKDLAHERGREAAKGYSYKHSNLQDRDLHRRQHKYDNGGRKNRERPLNK